MTTFLDTNVVIGAFFDTDAHHLWCKSQLAERKMAGPAIISDIVYCELAMSFGSKDKIDEALQELGLERMPATDEVLVRAGEAFIKYRKENKGPKLGVLPDFLIGALAEVEGAPLATTNARDYVSYFPEIELIKP